MAITKSATIQQTLDNYAVNFDGSITAAFKVTTDSVSLPDLTIIIPAQVAQTILLQTNTNQTVKDLLEQGIYNYLASTNRLFGS